MSSKPKDPSTVLEAENTEAERRAKGKKGKGKGKKRNPCLKKYKDYCIHGTCNYHRNLRQPSCVWVFSAPFTCTPSTPRVKSIINCSPHHPLHRCHQNYSGYRCQFIVLPVQAREGYNRTTALAVVAVVLSSLCLTVIGLLLMLRWAKHTHIRHRLPTTHRLEA